MAVPTLVVAISTVQKASKNLLLHRRGRGRPPLDGQYHRRARKTRGPTDRKRRNRRKFVGKMVRHCREKSQEANGERTMRAVAVINKRPVLDR